MCALVTSYAIVARTLAVAAYDIVWYGPVVDAVADVGAAPRWIGVQEPPLLDPLEDPPEELDEVPLDVPPPSSPELPPPSSPPEFPLEPVPLDEGEPELVPELEGSPLDPPFDVPPPEPDDVPELLAL